MLNHIVIMGRLTRDPEMRRTASGLAVVNFTVAVDRDFSGQNGEKQTDFIDCVAWRQTGEFVSKYFTKGNMIVISGRMEIRSWTDKDGNKRKSAEVNVEHAYFGESKRGSEGGGNTGSYGSYSGTAYPESMAAIDRYSSQSMPAYAEITDDDAQLPF